MSDLPYWIFALLFIPSTNDGIAMKYNRESDSSCYLSIERIGKLLNQQ